jgi:molecular chaperone GrpE (heat shock protein)
MANHSSSEFAIPRGEGGTATKDVSQLDSAGQAILKLLHKAADAAEANSQQALETVQKLSSQLRAAEDRIAALEAELQLNRDRAERAVGWLNKISTEIEHRLISQLEEKRRQMSRRG